MAGEDTTEIGLGGLERIARSALPGLEHLNERFARSFRGELSQHISKMCLVEQGETSQEKFGILVKALTVPSHLFVYKIKPKNIYGVLLLEQGFTTALTDISFGGGGMGKFKPKPRELTNIEQRVISKVVALTLGSYTEAWQSVSPMEFVFESYESNPLMLNAFQNTDMIVRSDFSVKIDEVEYTFSNLLPSNIAQDLKTTSQQVLVRQDGDTSLRLRENVTETDAEVSVEIASGKISLKQILDLKVGDVLELGTSAQEDATVKVQGKAKYKAKVGSKNGRHAANITKLLFD